MVTSWITWGGWGAHMFIKDAEMLGMEKQGDI